MLRAIRIQNKQPDKSEFEGFQTDFTKTDRGRLKFNPVGTGVPDCPLYEKINKINGFTPFHSAHLRGQSRTPVPTIR